MMSDCIICKIVQKKIPSAIIQETKTIIVFKDIAPKATFHYLIVPKKHIKDISSMQLADSDLAFEIFSMAKQLAQSALELNDFKIFINNGTRAGQEIFHLHAHFLAGFN